MCFVSISYHDLIHCDHGQIPIGSAILGRLYNVQKGIKVDRLRLVGGNKTNCFFIIDEHSCFIIDPGYEKDKIIKYVEKHQLEVLGILLTHGHIDHIGAADCFAVPVYLHEADWAILFANFTGGFAKYDQENPYAVEVLDLHPISGGDIIPCGKRNIEVIHTPGHSPGGACFKVENELYTGDTLFYHTVGRWIYTNGDQQALKSSIIRLLETTEETVHVHPAHGRPTTIGEEKRHNRFYHSWISSEEMLESH